MRGRVTPASIGRSITTSTVSHPCISRGSAMMLDARAVLLTVRRMNSRAPCLCMFVYVCGSCARSVAGICVCVRGDGRALCAGGTHPTAGGMVSAHVRVPICQSDRQSFSRKQPLQTRFSCITSRAPQQLLTNPTPNPTPRPSTRRWSQPPAFPAHRRAVVAPPARSLEPSPWDSSGCYNGGLMGRCYLVLTACLLQLLHTY